VRLRVTSLSFLAVLLFSSSASATTIRWDFHGVVTFVAAPLNQVPSVPSLGTPMFGYVIFDSTAPDLDPGDPSRGLYNSIQSFSVTIGADTWFSISGQAEALNNHPGVNGRDRYDLESDAVVQGVQGPSFSSFSPLTLILGLWDFDSVMLANDWQLIQPPDLSTLEIADVGVIFSDVPLCNPTCHTYTIDSHVTGITSVPEPNVLFLLATGLAALAMRRRV